MNARKQAIVYVTREIERALGMDPGPGYRIVSNRTRYSESVANKFPGHVTLIDDGRPGETAGTGDLLEHASTARAVADAGPGAYVMIFKNTARIEPIVRAHGWTLVNPPAATIEKIENKISQVMWLGPSERLLPMHRLETMKNAAWPGKPFILQWGHGYTGGGTILISNQEQLSELAAKFPHRRARLTEYIEGPSFTLNVVVTPEAIATGSVSYQITGLKPFTDNPFATIGNDWSLARKILSTEDMKVVDGMALELGERMRHEYWRGLFGIDFIKDVSTGKIYLIEINARQPASTTYESRLQEEKRRSGDPEAADKMTTFEAHIAALLGEQIKPIIPLSSGAQIIQRVTSKTRSAPKAASETLGAAGFSVVVYDNTEDNSDLVRVQSKNGVMSGHGELNEDGRMIAKSLS